MSALQGGNIYAVGECLNAGMNPFSYDRLGQTALEYAAPYQNVNGQDMQDLIRQAREQWQNQLSNDEIKEKSRLPDGMELHEGFTIDFEALGLQPPN